MKRILLACAAAALCAGSATARGQSPTATDAPVKEIAPPQQFLRPGDVAPPLSISKWVKGDPVERFEIGRIYVVEFWATWCGPCIESMPHMSALQQQHADKVTIIGLTKLDPYQDAAKVEAFVAEQPDRMGYRVAIDENARSFKAYMQAAGQNGIPCAFVVDGNGRIAFIGHPRQLDEVLTGLMAGTWDAAKDAPRVSDTYLEYQHLIQLAFDDPAGALPLIEAFQAAHPEFAGDLDISRYGALCRLRDDRAVPFGRTLLRKARIADDMDTVYFIARYGSDGMGATNPPGGEQLDLAFDAIREVVDATRQPDPQPWLVDQTCSVYRLLADICRAEGWYGREVDARRHAVEKAGPDDLAICQKELENAIVMQAQHERAAEWNQKIAQEVVTELRALRSRSETDPRGSLAAIGAFEAVHPTLHQGAELLRLDVLIRLDDVAAADVARSLIKSAADETDPPSAIGQVVMKCLAAPDPSKLPGLADVAVTGAKALVAESEREGSPHADQVWAAYAVLSNALSAAGRKDEADAALNHAMKLAPEEMQAQVQALAHRPSH